MKNIKNYFIAICGLFLIAFLTVILFFNSKVELFNKNKNKTTEEAYKYIIDNENNHYYNRGYIVKENEDDVYKYSYIIAMGEFSTGGYSITIENVNIKDDQAVITVKETTPMDLGPGYAVTMAFTYPSVTLKVNKKFKAVIVKNVSGEKYNEILKDNIFE